MLTGAQIRAARALLGWTSQTLADRSGVSTSTITRAERVDGVPRMRTDRLDAIQLSLEQGGVAFIDANSTSGAGVRFRRP